MTAPDFADRIAASILVPLEPSRPFDQISVIEVRELLIVAARMGYALGLGVTS